MFEGYDNCNNLPLVLQFGIVPPHQVTTHVGLEEGEDLGKALITPFLKITQNTSPEEHLGVAQLVGVLLHGEGTKHLLRYKFAINKGARRHSIGSQDGVSGNYQNV